jgi:dsDNA-specific endonuclease/ATPase MutS2
LAKLKEMKMPTDKDHLIKYLMDRLDCSEQAIQEAENCITNERAKRLQLKEELQQKNDDLRKIVEGEKKTLQDKVHEELEKTLNAAIQAKQKAEKELQSKINECKERDMMCVELDYQAMKMRHDVRETKVKNAQMEEEVKDMKGKLSTS